MIKSSPRDNAAYCVFGMHRSGTSALTQVLALAGASLPKNVMPADEHNAKGYFEPWRIAVFNDQRLRAAVSAWDDPFAFPYKALNSREEKRWISRATDLFEEEFAEAKHPLMKDPRISILGPLWRTVLQDLGLPVRAVVAVRHPLEVAGSLARRDRFPVEKSVLLWVAYMLGAEAYSRDLPRAFVAYDALLKDWRGQVSRIEAAHEAPLPALTPNAAKAIDSFLTQTLRHNEAASDLAAVPGIGPLAAKVYDWFQMAAQDTPRPPNDLDDATLLLTEMGASMGVFVSPITSDLTASKTEISELRIKLDIGKATIENLNDQITNIMVKFDDHVKMNSSLISQHGEKISHLEREIETEEANYRENLSSLEREIETKEANYRENLSSLEREIGILKSEYISKICTIEDDFVSFLLQLESEIDQAADRIDTGQ